MQQQYDPGMNPAGANEIAFMNQLRSTFDQLPNDIDLYLFTAPGMDDVFAQSIRQVVRAFREVTDKIRFREFGLDHDMAHTYGVTEGPTLLVSPEQYNISWMGAPMGEEGRTFLELLIFAGLGRSNLSEQSKKMMARLDAPREIKVFVSPTCPYCPQEAVNGIQAAIERPDLVSLELIDIQCRPDLADQYQAHSVPQAYANDVLIGKGAQQEEVFISSMLALEAQTIFIPDSDAELVETDLVVVGGGPAGLSAGIYAERSGIKTVVVERDALGGQVATTPIVENYPGFPQIGGKTLVDIMVTHALQYVQIFKGEEVLSIEPGDLIEVKTTRRRFKTKTLLLATGASHVHLGVPGEERFSGRGVSYCATCDGPLFKGRKVFMVGGGNSAVTEAMHLKHQGVDVTLVHRRDTLRAQEVLVHQLKEAGVPILWNTEIKAILGEEKVNKVEVFNNQSGETATLDADGVFIAIGYTPTVELARKAGVELTEEGYIQHDDKHRTNIPGIYSAGDVEGGYKQIVTATGQGSSAAMTIFEDLINPYWKEKAALESA
ncbi:MAG: FAD-dependent oxidoreductase [Desulfosarcinaceae bacterium]|nr:FAD-dependent oxidoreductase [Desulfosarcinaceae bacterium]